MSKKVKKKKAKTIKKIFITLSMIGIVIWIVLYAINYFVGEEQVQYNADGSESLNKQKKTEINALVCGINENLTDTIIYVKYYVNTGKLYMMSIPRDTYVKNEYCIGNKINAIYRGKNIVPLVEEIQKLLNTQIDYYLVFDTAMVHKMVDAVGGVEIDVPMRMKYDDPTQKLHIDLQPGVQLLNGEKSEQFVRFRHNNDMTVGYGMGDIQRTKVQQYFLKEFIKTCVNPKNITKYPDLIKIVINNTNINITVREALKYSTDITKFSVDNIQSLTAPGEAKYIDNLSYYILDEKEAQRIIKEDWLNSAITEEVKINK
ncbi:MAG: LCP family protein [Clostridia bacterium]